MDKSIPDKYFQRFPENLMKRLELMEDDLSSVAPELLKLGKENVYTIPEGYFGQVKTMVLLETTGTIKKKSVFNWRTLVMSIAALLLLVVMCTVLLRDKDEQLEPLELAQTIEDVDSDFFFSVASIVELENWLTEDKDFGLGDLSDDELETMYDQVIRELALEEFSDKELSELL